MMPLRGSEHRNRIKKMQKKCQIELRLKKGASTQTETRRAVEYTSFILRMCLSYLKALKYSRPTDKNGKPKKSNGN